MLRGFNDPANHKEAVEVIARLLKRPLAMLEDWLFTKKDFYCNAHSSNGSYQISSIGVLPGPKRSSMWHG